MTREDRSDLKAKAARANETRRKNAVAAESRLREAAALEQQADTIIRTAAITTQHAFRLYARAALLREREEGGT